jgi:hypothetical protein
MLLSTDEEKEKEFRRSRKDKQILSNATFMSVMETTSSKKAKKEFVDDEPDELDKFGEYSANIIKLEAKKQPKMTREEIDAMSKSINAEIEQIVKQPTEKTPEEIIAKAAESRLKVSDLSKHERKRLNALRELSKMNIDETRAHKSEA